ncbi:hypothetical protein BDFB_012582 [Asbolus verrucosus]|uniref:Uncharacterized protein n=1 Tax=Asbolus verrucosus TaxID=1661398 RepID=A0A482VLT0_ASBVE|nr:hypothetical protein BDFB_012582 [Asbolus verrucosus]
MDFEDLSVIGTCVYSDIHPTDLQVDQKYKIPSLSKIETKYGILPTVELEGVGRLFLPKRLTVPLTDERISGMLKNGTYLIYKGEKHYKDDETNKDVITYLYKFAPIMDTEH